MDWIATGCNPDPLDVGGLLLLVASAAVEDEAVSLIAETEAMDVVADI